MSNFTSPQLSWGITILFRGELLFSMGSASLQPIASSNDQRYGKSGPARGYIFPEWKHLSSGFILIEWMELSPPLIMRIIRSPAILPIFSQSMWQHRDVKLATFDFSAQLNRGIR